MSHTKWSSRRRRFLNRQFNSILDCRSHNASYGNTVEFGKANRCKLIAQGINGSTVPTAKRLPDGSPLATRSLGWIIRFPRTETPARRSILVVQGNGTNVLSIIQCQIRNFIGIPEGSNIRRANSVDPCFEIPRSGVEGRNFETPSSCILSRSRLISANRRSLPSRHLRPIPPILCRSRTPRR